MKFINLKHPHCGDEEGMDERMGLDECEEVPSSGGGLWAPDFTMGWSPGPQLVTAHTGTTM